MDLVFDIGRFVVGLVLILKGADWLTDGASAVARRLNVSTLVIGLTIVAFGTSAPELVVSLLSSLEGETEIAVGNVVGSNLFNVLAIMGITAIVAPVSASKDNICYDVPLCILASAVLFVMANDSIFDGEGYVDMLSRTDGMVLIAFFCVFLAYTFAIARKGVPEKQTACGSETTVGSVRKSAGMFKSAILIVVGLAGLVFGGDWLVDGASGMAAKFGVSQSVIALTIVSAGTSFPELVTSVVAARKGDTDMAMGNIVGSNIFNIFAILGIAAIVSPLTLGNITVVDFSLLLFSTLALWGCCKFGKRYHYITRAEGVFLVLCMVGYYVYLLY